MKSRFFNALVVFTTVMLAYRPIHALPDRMARPAAVVPVGYGPVSLPASNGPLQLAGAWSMKVADPRFGGLSALAIDQGQFLAVSDRGAAVRFDPPSAAQPRAALQDLRVGPGFFGKKWSRDAESLVRDPRGRGWWVGYEQNHSLWLYDQGFARALDSKILPPLGWRDNRGAEALLAIQGALLVLGENGRQAIRVGRGGRQVAILRASAEIADAATAPDGSAWVLLREKGVGGISQWIGSLVPARDGYSVDERWAVPKGAFDNYEGLAIAALPDGRWRFWLISDDGHRFMARSLLVALDYAPAGHDKSPATGAGLSKKPIRQKS